MYANTLHCPGHTKSRTSKIGMASYALSQMDSRSAQFYLCRRDNPSPSSPDWIPMATVTQPVIVHHSIHLVLPGLARMFSRSALSQGEPSRFQTAGPVLLARPPVSGVGGGGFNPPSQTAGPPFFSFASRPLN